MRYVLLGERHLSHKRRERSPLDNPRFLLRSCYVMSCSEALLIPKTSGRGMKRPASPLGEGPPPPSVWRRRETGDVVAAQKTGATGLFRLLTFGERSKPSPKHCNSEIHMLAISGGG